MIGLLIARVVIEYLFFLINAYVTNKAIKYSIIEQIKDIFPNYLMSFLAGGITYFILTFINFSIASKRLNALIIILIAFIIFTFIYILLSGLFRFKGFIIYKEILLQKSKKKYK